MKYGMYIKVEKKIQLDSIKIEDFLNIVFSNMIILQFMTGSLGE